MLNTKTKSLSEQDNALNSKVNMSGAGEDPAVKGLLSDEFLTMKDTDALQIANQLKAIIRGQELTLKQFQAMSARMEKFEDNAEKYENDKQRFLDEVRMNSEKLKEIGDNKINIMANGIKEYEHEVKAARVNAASDNLKFTEFLAKQPKVMVVSPGKLVNVSGAGGSPSSQLMSEEVRIKNKRWVLVPGQMTEVPKVVADVIAQRRQTEQESRRRELVLSKHKEAVEVAEEWNNINKEFNSPAEAIPV